ncbi:MAG: prepilin-type N-terminal cleavage/methylation domain-containing protein [Patescibacteria group bacterium]
MKIKNSKGFTIIELLVVVAIIAVLAAIVLVNVTQYINQGKNAAIKGNMTTILTNAAVYYDTNNHYGGFSASSGYTAPAAAADSANGASPAAVFGCDKAACAFTDAPTRWCSCITLLTTSTDSGQFCVDSSGYKGATATVCTGVGGRCTIGTAATDGKCN